MSVKLCEGQPDVVIGGHQDDHDLMTYLADGLSKAGIGVWYLDRGLHAADRRTVAETVVEAKVYVIVMSEVSVGNEELKDEVALAYISNTVIFPVARSSYRKLAPLIDSGLKLMLARIQWVFLTKEEHYAERMAPLVAGIGTVLGRPPPDNEANVSPEFASGTFSHFPTDYQPASSPDEEQPKTEETQFQANFWQRHFENETVVSWTKFRDAFKADYGNEVVKNFGDDKGKFFENLLYRDLFDLKKSITMNEYEQFVGSSVPGKNNNFYNRMCAFAQGSEAMKAVFDMDSTVRLTAIQNLGTFKTPSVVRQLMSLTRDSDPNIKAVATLALAKAGTRSKTVEDRLISMIADKDRLVRESACLSLAHMKSARAVPYIIKLWRNDPIKHVREAAELALSRSGGLKAQEAMKVTRVLTSEVEALRMSSKRSEKS